MKHSAAGRRILNVLTIAALAAGLPASVYAAPADTAAFDIVQDVPEEDAGITEIAEDTETTENTVMSGGSEDSENGELLADADTTIDLSAPSTASACYSVEQTDENGATIITITADGSYILTGNAANTAVIVKKGTTAQLTLKNAVIDNSGYTGSAIEAVIDGKASSNVSIVLSGTSAIYCNSANSAMENAVKHHKTAGESLTFSGDGTLTISGTCDDAVKYKNGTVEIVSGTLTITDCRGDGIQAENINISGGTTNITLAYANASDGYYTSGSSSVSGMNTIWETGSDPNSTSTKYERVNVDTGSHKALKGGTKAKSYSYTSVADEDAGSYTAGTTYTQSASGGITISGGTVNIDTTATGLKANSVSASGYTAASTGTYIIGSPDDGIHSNNTLEITGGTINIAASDDALTAADALTITGTPVINITTAYEGIEGKTITIGTSGASAGPDITICSNDDGINSASKTVTYTYDSSDNEDYNYLKTSVSSASGNNTYIYSGTVKIYIDSANAKTVTLAGKSISYNASGDGIDCNGALDIEGGTVYVFGQTSGDNSPIDTNDGFTLSDQATVLAAGVDSMNETAPASGSGVYLTWTGSGTSATAVKAGSSSGSAQGGNMGPGGGQTGGPGGSSSGGPGGNGSFGFGSTNGPGQSTGNTGSISAGTAFTVKNGSTVLISETLPYAASYVLFASPELTAGTSYTISNESAQSSDNTGSSTGGNTDDSTGDNTGSNTGSSTGGNTGSSTGGNTGSSTEDNSGDSTGDTTQTEQAEITAVTLSAKTFTYTGKVQKPDVKTVKAGDTVLTSDDYTVTYAKNNSKIVGSYDVTVTGKGNYTGSITTTYRIKKAANPLTVSGQTVTLKYSKLQTADRTLKRSKIVAITTKGKGTKTYKLASAKKGSTSYKKYFSVDASTGKLTVKKGLPKGTYTLKIKVKAAGNTNFKASGYKIATVKVTVS